MSHNNHGCSIHRLVQNEAWVLGEKGRGQKRRRRAGVPSPQSALARSEGSSPLTEKTSPQRPVGLLSSQSWQLHPLFLGGKDRWAGLLWSNWLNPRGWHQFTLTISSSSSYGSGHSVECPVESHGYFFQVAKSSLFTLNSVWLSINEMVILLFNEGKELKVLDMPASACQASWTSKREGVPRPSWKTTGPLRWPKACVQSCLFSSSSSFPKYWLSSKSFSFFFFLNTVQPCSSCIQSSWLVFRETSSGARPDQVQHICTSAPPLPMEQCRPFQQSLGAATAKLENPFHLEVLVWHWVLLEEGKD